MTAAAKPALKREAVPGESSQSPHLNLDQKSLQELFDRQAFPFAHNLSSLDLFTADSLRGLSEKFSGFPRDYFIAGSAASPETKFYCGAEWGARPRGGARKSR